MINFSIILLIITTYLSVVVGQTTKQLCPSNANFCFTVDKVDDNQLKFTVQGSNSNGYMAIGLGKSMSDSDIFITWFDSKDKPRVVYRKGVGHTQPQTIDSTAAQLNVSNQSAKDEKNQKIVFLRSIKAPIQNGVDINSLDNIDMIWASAANKPSDEGRISKHTVRGTINVKLVSNPNNLSDPKDGNNSNSGSGTTEPTEDSTPSEGLQLFTLLHGLFMMVAWLVLPPIAIFIARFMKDKLGVWWFRLHFSLFIFTFLFSLIAVVLMVIKNGNALENPHSIIGVTVLVLFLIQILLGIFIDKMWTPNRKKIPITDKIHWWLGRSLFLLALSNIVYGITIVGNPIYFWVLFAIFISATIFSFTYGTLKMGKVTH